MPAILFGSISTVADTSELQRQAFNEAFTAHGLTWRWDRADYQRMLAQSGGQCRVQDYARLLEQIVDAEAIHQSKSKIFQAHLAATRLTPREGVLSTIEVAQRSGWKLGLVTTTSRSNISALLQSLSPDLGAHDFDVIVDSSSVEAAKPDKAAYVYALQSLGEPAKLCVGIEDNFDGLASAVAAGLTCVAFPNTNTESHNFTAAAQTVDRLDADELQQLIDIR